MLGWGLLRGFTRYCGLLYQQVRALDGHPDLVYKMYIQAVYFEI